MRSSYPTLLLVLAALQSPPNAGAQNKSALRQLSSAFRTTTKQIALTRVLETGAHFCKVQLEVTWDRRVQPFLFDPRKITVRYGPDQASREHEYQQGDKGPITVTGRNSAEIEVQVPAPDRSVSHIKSVEGSFSVILPTKMLQFTFDRLKAPVSQEQEGITARLHEFTVDEDHWTVMMKLQYPKGGPQFESYQSWLGNNKIVLEKIQGKERWMPSGERTHKLTSDQAVVEYYFEKTSGKNSADWKAVYDTPGRIVEVTVPFQFKDLRLP
jgi:hypothetical protein